jgi:serine/threonine protein kinase
MNFEEIPVEGRFGTFKVSKRLYGKKLTKVDHILRVKNVKVFLDETLGSLVLLSYASRAYGRDLETVFTDDFNVSVERKRNMLRQSAIGLKYLHQQNILHKNINPNNVLITAPNCHGIEVVKLMSQGKPNECYLAPETQTAGQHHEKSDIFALGCIFHFIIHNGLHPFDDSQNIKGMNSFRFEKHQ